jgi:hypothetical protein
MFLRHAFMGGAKLQHLVWNVYDELIDISSSFYCFSWSCAFDWLWRFDDEWSLSSAQERWWCTGQEISLAYSCF